MEKPNKIFYDNREFKVLFRCRQCKFSMYESVAKLPCGEIIMWRNHHVAKLLATVYTGTKLGTREVGFKILA